MRKTIVLDICKHEEPEAQTLVLRQWDRRSVTLDIKVMEDGEPFDVANYEARFLSALVGTDRVIIEKCVKTGGNALSYTLPGMLTRRPGVINLAYIAFYEGDEWVASTECMTFIIQKGVDITVAEALSWIPEFEKLKKQLDDIVAECGDIKANIYQQINEQQEAWEEQSERQQAAFDAAEQKRYEEHLAAIEALTGLYAITDPEIDEIWAGEQGREDQEHQEEGGAQNG